MGVFFSIVVFIALNIIPADIDVFEVVVPTVNVNSTEEVIRFSKQNNKSWHAVELPRDDFGSFTLEGSKLKISPSEADRKSGNMKEDMVVPMDNFLKLPEDINWTSITKLKLKSDGQVSISRTRNEIAVNVTIGAGEQSRQQAVIIRWKKKK